jgi:hypothetical protein
MFILPAVEKKPSFSSQLGAQLGGGFSQAIAQGMPDIIKAHQRQKMFSSLLGSPKQETGSAGQFGEQMSHDPFEMAKKLAIAGEHDLSRVYADEAKQERKERFAREASAEPKLQELEDKVSSYEQEGMRFDRLGQLFSKENDDKFPSSAFVGFATDKEGNISPKLSGILSTEAQESVKLVADNLTAAKDTFGARLTNFDVQSYMKRLPTLLNSAEGRRRVLKDLKIINTINKEHSQGVLDVMDRYGGPSRISVSKAQRIFKKEYAPRMKELREEFVQGDKKNFSSLPDAARFYGKKMKDEETGQIFTSDGSKWIPE